VAGATGVTIRIVSNKLASTAAGQHAETLAAVSRAGFAIEAAGKAKAPVLTGTLRRSIHTVLSNGGATATVGPSVNYGIFVEFGTRRMGARPYMRPAAELVFPRFVDEIKAITRKVY
jgi:HK97 gp10 family phage protein